ncbi:hypothetical protein HID58_054749 [Brassica napus]|uniref:F-box domain-containing protein n=1 Tax=Brassica napus TaxID=3708 RepID=A0ABQ8AIH0_BRANA|nr:hypothetical protein HID58_054749 [Brassica napus]
MLHSVMVLMTTIFPLESDQSSIESCKLKLPRSISDLRSLKRLKSSSRHLRTTLWIYTKQKFRRLVDECVDYCRTCNGDINPKAHQIFYSGCQAIMYVLCFRKRSILVVPRFRSELIPLESILMHKLNPLKFVNISASMPDVPMKRMSNASVWDFVHLDFEKGAAKMMCKRGEMSNANFHMTQLQWNCSQIDGNRMSHEEAWYDSFSYIDSDSDDGSNSSVFEDANANASAMGQVIQYEEFYGSYLTIDGNKAETFSNKIMRLKCFITGNFIYWSMVRPTYDDEDDGDEDAEIIVNGDEESNEEEEDDVDHVMDKMSITPKHSFMNEMERDRLLEMPSVIKPSIISLLCLRIGVKQGSCSGMSYTMDFENRANAKPDDSTIEYQGFAIEPLIKKLKF